MSSAIVHGQFTIERNYAATPERVYAAWGDLGAKAQWFIGPPDIWRQTRRELDFRVGGTEVLAGKFGDSGRTSNYNARFHCLVPAERIVYDYDMYVNEVFHSVSLSSVELIPTPNGGTRLRYTEQVAFLDGTKDIAGRDKGNAIHLDRLGEYLSRGVGH
jgi:uncharacterized protein YndB with AHSA1/START domain